jgi:predicted nucleotide-binding protein (sugar kinase/HSP70/actin superfamily)
MTATSARDAQFDKTIYVPYMCDHGYMLAAAMEADGLRVEALPPPDDESLSVGLELCRGRECLPCLAITGDIIRRSRQPGFDPARVAILIPTTGGLCRLGQYWKLQQQILKDQGLGEVEFLLPSTSNGYQGLGRHPQALRFQMWQGLVAVDLLFKLLHQYRPYERYPGQADRAYAECLQDLLAVTRAGGGKRLVAAMQRVAGRFEALEVDRREQRPLIGLVGEIYVRLNNFGNQQIIRKLEANGGEVVSASLMEWIYFANWLRTGRSRKMNQYRDLVSLLLEDLYERHEERRIGKPVAHLLRDPRESPVAELMGYLAPHYEPLMGMEGEAALSLGKAVEFAHLGLCGIVNVMPFSCMPGIIVAGLAPRFRADLQNIPWLDISYDAQGGTNIQTRLEAFTFQARQYQRQMGGAAPALAR